MAGEIPAGQLGERPVGVDRLGGAEPVAPQDERLLAPGHRASDDQAVQARAEQDVNERLALGAHAGRVEAVAQLPADQRPVRGQRVRDDAEPALRPGRRHPLLGQPARARGVE